MKLDIKETGERTMDLKIIIIIAVSYLYRFNEVLVKVHAASINAGDY